MESSQSCFEKLLFCTFQVKKDSLPAKETVHNKTEFRLQFFPWDKICSGPGPHIHLGAQHWVTKAGVGVLPGLLTTVEVA
jgi:hypothetical protein